MNLMELELERGPRGACLPLWPWPGSSKPSPRRPQKFRRRCDAGAAGRGGPGGGGSRGGGPGRSRGCGGPAGGADDLLAAARAPRRAAGELPTRSGWWWGAPLFAARVRSCAERAWPRRLRPKWTETPASSSPSQARLRELTRPNPQTSRPRAARTSATASSRRGAGAFASSSGEAAGVGRARPSGRRALANPRRT